MKQNDLQMAYDIVSNFTKYDTMSNPPKINTLYYKVPKQTGISRWEYYKDIEEVSKSTLEYILYRLHNASHTLIMNTLIALLYYWRFRERKPTMMQQVYNEAVSHYTVENQPYTRYESAIKVNCVYLIKINIGCDTLYKVGQTEDIHSRMINLQSNISKRYSSVSVGVVVQEVKYCSNCKEVEEELLKEARNKLTKKHKFYFDGHTESFESDKLIDIFKQIIYL